MIHSKITTVPIRVEEVPLFLATLVPDWGIDQSVPSRREYERLVGKVMRRD